MSAAKLVWVEPPIVKLISGGREILPGDEFDDEAYHLEWTDHNTIDVKVTYTREAIQV